MSKQYPDGAAWRDAARFPPELTLGEARARLFAPSGFPAWLWLAR